MSFHVIEPGLVGIVRGPAKTIQFEPTLLDRLDSTFSCLSRGRKGQSGTRCMDHSFWLRYFFKMYILQLQIGGCQTVATYLLLPGGVKKDGENVSRSLRFGGGSYQG